MKTEVGESQVRTFIYFVEYTFGVSYMRLFLRLLNYMFYTNVVHHSYAYALSLLGESIYVMGY